MEHVALDENERRRLRAAIWAVLGGAVLALTGIFGFGALTDAGNYFSDDKAEKAAAVADQYWQIWGMLLPLAIATVISGVALVLLARSLERISDGWRTRIITIFARAVIPLTLLASIPYWFGPEFDSLGVPGWVEAVAGISGMLAYLATIALGVAIIRLPVPTWTGVALIVGAVLALVSFLPLFVFGGTLAASFGLLRWSREPSGVATIATA